MQPARHDILQRFTPKTQRIKQESEVLQWIRENEKNQRVLSKDPKFKKLYTVI